MTHNRYGRTTQYSCYRQSRIYTDSPDPIVFLTIVVNTWGRVYEDFTRLLSFHTHREASIFAGELP
jgi:hypothetical protein